MGFYSAARATWWPVKPGITYIPLVCPTSEGREYLPYTAMAGFPTPHFAHQKYPNWFRKAVCHTLPLLILFLPPWSCYC